MKKSGKRVFSLVLTLILAFALAVPAFAANVTIESEHNKKATYEAYKLMTLTTSLKCGETDTPGHVHDEGCYNYSYKINSKYENILKDVLKITAAETGKTLDQTIMDAIAAKSGEEVRALAEDLYDKIKAASLEHDEELSQGAAKPLAQGYWLIVDSTATLPDGVTRSLVMLDTAGAEEITINAKDDTIDIGKTVTTPAVDLTPETSAEYGTVNIGDTITFTLTSSLPADLAEYDHPDPDKKYQFKFVDTMSDGLEFIAIKSVKIGGEDVPAYVAEDTAQSTPEKPGYQTSGFFTGGTPKNGRGEIDLSTYVQANLNTLGSQKVVVEYTARLTEDAVVEDNGSIKEENKVYVEFTNDYDTFQKGNTPEKDVDVYSFTLDIFKYTDDNGDEGYQVGDTHLAGAEFQLYKTVNDTTYYAKANEVTVGGGNYKITGWAEMTGDEVPTGAATFITPESGKLDIDGLDLGTYYLRETKAPEGYNLLADPIEIKIEDKAGDNALEPVVEIPVRHVENSSGVELPSTGGIGTTIFYTLGGLLAVGAAVFLVTKKRMSGVEE